MALNITLREVATQNNHQDREFNKTPMETFGQHDISSFLQVIRVFGESNLDSITAGECDYAFNTLLRDIKLYLEDPTLWCKYAQYLCNTIQYLTTDLSTSSVYRTEYCIFMTERERYKVYHDDATKFISMYNQIVIKWRF